MSPTPLPSLRELFPNLIKPRGDDPTIGSRLITPQLVLDKVNPSAYTVSASPVDTDDCNGYPKTRKHVCRRCGKRFNRPSSLAIHCYTHTGERPYLCPFPGCLRTFNVSSNMRRHYKNHDFLANNRSRPQTKPFRTSYSPPLQPDVYPPPPLQWRFSS